jgi:hypothetical protein
MLPAKQPDAACNTPRLALQNDANRPAKNHKSRKKTDLLCLHFRPKESREFIIPSSWNDYSVMME